MKSLLLSCIGRRAVLIAPLLLGACGSQNAGAPGLDGQSVTSGMDFAQVDEGSSMSAVGTLQIAHTSYMDGTPAGKEYSIELEDGVPIVLDVSGIGQTRLRKGATLQVQGTRHGQLLHVTHAEEMDVGPTRSLVANPPMQAQDARAAASIPAQ